MSEFDETLSAVLGNPDAMDQIMALAQSLSAGTQPENGTSEAAADPGKEGKVEPPARENGAGNDPGAVLLHALEPYLKEERRRRLDRALELARTTRLIRTAVIAMSEKGESGRV